MKKRKITASGVIMLIILLLYIVPFYILIAGSLKNNSALELSPPDFNIFRNVNSKSYAYAFSKLPVLRWMTNSIAISVLVGLFTVFVSATAGYALARHRTPFFSFIFALDIAIMILPQTMLLIPNYIVANKLSLTDSIIGVVLTSVNPAFGVFLCRQFMLSLPQELFEAAELDGCSEMGKFTRIAVPLSLPAFGALFLFSFLGVWNDFLWQSIMLTSAKHMTLAMGIETLLSGIAMTKYSYQFAVSVLSVLPVLILFFSCQKFFIKGITAGSVKG